MTTKFEMDSRTADGYAKAFLRSAGVLTYRDRRRSHRIHALVWVSMLAIFGGILVLTAGPSLVTSVHQALAVGRQAVQLVKWTPQP